MKRRGGPKSVPLDVRFWRKAHRAAPSECWMWRGAQASGYGRIRFGDRTIAATHASWLLHNFELPRPGVEVCHRCDNPLCINPAHLFLADHAGNVADMVAKGRTARGERKANARLTKERVERILGGKEAAKALAKEFGVALATIYHARNGRSWRHVVQNVHEKSAAE